MAEHLPEPHATPAPAARMPSKRHRALLDSYRDGTSIMQGWTREKLGNIILRHWQWGSASLVWDIDDRYIMPDGVVFGGHIAAVADHLVALGAMTVLGDSRERFRTSRLEVNFFRPLTKCQVDIAVSVTNASKSLIHVQADISTPEQKLAARIQAVQVRRMTG